MTSRSYYLSKVQ